MNGKRVVFFDAGFTLVEPVTPIPDVYWREARRWCDEAHQEAFRTRLKEEWPNVVRDYRSKYPDFESSEELEREAWRRFTHAVAAPFPELRARQDEWLERLFDHFDEPSAWKPVEGVQAVIERLDREGCRMGVVSNWHGALHAILKGHGLSDAMTFVLTSAEVGRKKPHERMFLTALERAGEHPSRAVHIGDSWEEDVLGARASGLDAIHFNHPASMRTQGDGTAPAIERWVDLWNALAR